VLIKPYLLEELRRFPALSAEALAEGDYLHISFDGESADLDLSGTLAYGNLYPARSHIYLHRPAARIPSPGSIEGIGDIVMTGRQAESLLGILMQPDLRVRIEALSQHEYGLERFEIPLKDFLKTLSAREGSTPALFDEYFRRTAAQDRIGRQLCAVFDPDRIMLP